MGIDLVLKPEERQGVLRFTPSSGCVAIHALFPSKSKSNMLLICRKNILNPSKRYSNDIQATFEQHPYNIQTTSKLHSNEIQTKFKGHSADDIQTTFKQHPYNIQTTS